MKVAKKLLKSVRDTLREVGEEKWNSIRKLPPFESWFRVELCASYQKNDAYKILGFETVAKTKYPKSKQGGWCPDLLLYSNSSNSLIWIELKVVSLARHLVNQESSIRHYRHAINADLKALNGYSAAKTKAYIKREISENRNKQELQNMGNCREDIREKIIKKITVADNYGALIILLTIDNSKLPEDIVKRLISQKNFIKEKIFENKSDQMIILCKKLNSRKASMNQKN